MEKIKNPILVINFKSYMQASGKNAVKLAILAEQAAKKTGKSIIVCVPAIDLRMVASKVQIPVFAQHVDPHEFGAHTGSVLPEAIKDAGALGTLINHAEKSVSDEHVFNSIKKCKELGLITVVCAKSELRALALAKFNPDYIALEPPELIGGDVSVSTAAPEVVEDTAKRIRSESHVPLLCGAGVKDVDDVKAAIKLGTKGVLLASGVTKAEDPYQEILDLLEGFK